MLVYRTLPEMYRALAPVYRSWSKKHAVVRIQRWSSVYGNTIYNRFGSGVQKRFDAYLDHLEIERVQHRLRDGKEASIRFGVEKRGRGYFRGKSRGDFCLVAGVVRGRSLTLFYRTLEMGEGICHDIALIDELGRRLGISWYSVTFHVNNLAFFGSNSKPRKRRHQLLLELLNATA